MIVNCAKCERAIEKGYSTRACARPAIGYWMLAGDEAKRAVCKRHWEAMKKKPFVRFVKFESV